MLVDRFLMHPLCMPVSVQRVLQSLSRMLLPGLVILFAVLRGRGTVRVGCHVVQLGSLLMVFVMGSVVVSGHQSFAICPDLVWASWASS